MKRITTTILMLLATGLAFGQTVNGIKVEDIPVKYIRIVSTPKPFKPYQSVIYLDYGQITKLKEIKKGMILNEDGTTKTFNGIMGAINFLSSKGFKYVNQLPSPQGVYTEQLMLENTNIN
jgi:hypothetical protein